MATQTSETAAQKLTTMLAELAALSANTAKENTIELVQNSVQILVKNAKELEIAIDDFPVKVLLKKIDVKVTSENVDLIMKLVDVVDMAVIKKCYGEAYYKIRALRQIDQAANKLRADLQKFDELANTLKAQL